MDMKADDEESMHPDTGIPAARGGFGRAPIKKINSGDKISHISKPETGDFICAEGV
jgi:hypothetical protein